MAEKEMQTLGFRSVAHMFDFMEHRVQYDSQLRLKVGYIDQFNDRMHPLYQTNAPVSQCTTYNRRSANSTHAAVTAPIDSHGSPVTFYRSRRIVKSTTTKHTDSSRLRVASITKLLGLASEHQQALVKSRHRAILIARRTVDSNRHRDHW